MTVDDSKRKLTCTTQQYTTTTINVTQGSVQKNPPMELSSSVHTAKKDPSNKKAAQSKEPSQSRGKKKKIKEMEMEMSGLSEESVYYSE